jgi:hypothetical protein
VIPEQTSVFLSLNRDEDKLIGITNKPRALSVDGLTLPLEESLAVIKSPSAFELFEHHGIETMVHDAMCGFNLCVIYTGDRPILFPGMKG